MIISYIPLYTFGCVYSVYTSTNIVPSLIYWSNMKGTQGHRRFDGQIENTDHLSVTCFADFLLFVFFSIL